MRDAVIDRLVKRLDGLERANRQLKRVGALGLAVLAAVLFMGQATPSNTAKVVEAERFTVRDPFGRRVAELSAGLTTKPEAASGVDGFYFPSIKFYDGTGALRATLGIMLDTPVFSLAAKDGKARVRLDLNDDGSPSFNFLDSDGKLRTVLGQVGLEKTHTGVIEQRPPSSLVFFNKEGKAIWKAP